MAANGDATRTVKRRGILAAAGAVVAGIVAKQAAQPVAATDGSALIVGVNNTTTNATTLQWTGGTINTGSVLQVYDTAPTTAVAMVAGVSTGGKADRGVYGEAASGTGVVGVGGIGVSARSNSGTPNAIGAYGDAGPYGYGVFGTTAHGFGVYGTNFGLATDNIGVHGDSGGYAGVRGLCAGGGTGVFGATGTANAPPLPAFAAGGIGVQGQSATGIGVYGTTSAVGQYGVLGQSLVDGAFGLTGIANTNNSAAFAGGTLNPSSFAASFQGHVQIFDGAFDVAGLGNKHGITAHPDGSWRTFYSLESPECWVEDFGEGTLVAGKAEITLDADFAALIHTNNYHVFLTEHGGHNGLHTTAKTGNGFSVAADHELAAAKGKSAANLAGTFAWRVVARPKTDAKVERLAKARLAPKLEMATLPKAEARKQPQASPPPHPPSGGR